MNLKLYKAKNELRKIDGFIKIFFILFCCSFFDFVQFILSINTPQFINVSNSFSSRIRGLLIIFDALFYYFVLRLPALRHHLFCLIIIGTCLLIVIITEFIFQEITLLYSFIHNFSLLNY